MNESLLKMIAIKRTVNCGQIVNGIRSLLMVLMPPKAVVLTTSADFLRRRADGDGSSWFIVRMT